jgi:DNA invertase Pin-like site-specific DNA recombinase
MKVIGYARLSPRPEEGFGIDVQINKMKAYCDLYDLDLVLIKAEPGLVSGKSLNRPALQEALELLRKGVAQGVLVAKLDRLSRNVVDMGHLITTYFERDYSLFCVAEQVNTKTAAGRMVLNILTVIAQWERETISERTSEAMQYLISQGVQVGRPGFGYEYTDDLDEQGRKVVQVIPEEMETLERMVYLRKLGHTFKEVAMILEGEGRNTKRGGRWYAGTVQKVLSRSGVR